MNVNAFLKFVEIQTKVASVIPYLLGVAFAYYRYGEFQPVKLIVFLLSLLCVDMATTAINNYLDYRRANKKDGFNYEEHNAMVKYKIKDSVAITVIVLLLAFGGIFGFALAYMTDLVILLVGLGASFVGIIYSFGPLPISRTPLGELFSGLLMGGFIFFVAVYSQVVDYGFIWFELNQFVVSVDVHLLEMFIYAVVCAPMIFTIANIMLANNLCDLEDDVINRRYTLPYYIGRKYGLILFELLYGCVYLAMVVGVVFGWLPLTTILVLLTIVPVRKGIKTFRAKQTKKDTFVVAVKSHMIIGVSYILTLTLGGFL